MATCQNSPLGRLLDYYELQAMVPRRTDPTCTYSQRGANSSSISSSTTIWHANESVSLAFVCHNAICSKVRLPEYFKVELCPGYCRVEALQLRQPDACTGHSPNGRRDDAGLAKLRVTSDGKTTMAVVE